MKKVIFLQAIGQLDRHILIKLKKNLEWVLKDYVDRVEILSGMVSLNPKEYDETRGQYNASIVLNRIKKMFCETDKFRILGITDKDMYASYLNFIFGIARSRRGSFIKLSTPCMVSITRLREDFYRRSENDYLLELRTLKESIHELGHTFGLDHCENHCVMQFSTSISYADEKPVRFCSDCLEDLDTNFNAYINFA